MPGLDGRLDSGESYHGRRLPQRAGGRSPTAYGSCIRPPHCAAQYGSSALVNRADDRIGDPLVFGGLVVRRAYGPSRSVTGTGPQPVRKIRRSARGFELSCRRQMALANGCSASLRLLR